MNNIDHKRVDQWILANHQTLRHLPFYSWDDERFPDLPRDDLANLLLLGSALSFCFLNDNGETIRSPSGRSKGSDCLWETLQLHAGSFSSGLYPPADFDQTLLSDLAFLPLLAKRADALSDVRRLLGRYDGRAAQLLQGCHNDALALERELVTHAPTFADSSYGTPFNKKARLFIAMANSRIRALSSVALIGGLADYQVPRLLTEEGMLVLPDDVQQAIDRRQPFDPGGEGEFIIRSATLLVIERISSKVQDLCPLKLDFHLWALARTVQTKAHVCYTEFY